MPCIQAALSAQQLWRYTFLQPSCCITQSPSQCCCTQCEGICSAHPCPSILYATEAQICSPACVDTQQYSQPAVQMLQPEVCWMPPVNLQISAAAAAAAADGRGAALPCSSRGVKPGYAFAGNPKGVMLTHRNVVAAVVGLQNYVGQGDIQASTYAACWAHQLRPGASMLHSACRLCVWRSLQSTPVLHVQLTGQVTSCSALLASCLRTICTLHQHTCRFCCTSKHLQLELGCMNVTAESASCADPDTPDHETGH